MRKSVRQEPWFVRVPLIVFTVLFLGVLVLGPLANVFAQGLELGFHIVVQAMSNAEAVHALQLTLIAAGCAVVFNLLFGLAAAWAIARFRFPGKTALNALIDLPFTVSPVIAGLIFVLIFGAHGFVGPLDRRVANVLIMGVIGFVAFILLGIMLPGFKRAPQLSLVLRYGALLGLPVVGWFLPAAQDRIEIIFALPAIVLATTFVTFPFIARELIPLMETLGPAEEEAARTLGASGWQMFWYVTLPNIKWGLVYGVLLCNARAIGEFGAVNVVSGKLAGRTDTLPIYIEKLYQGFGAVQTASAFAVSAVLCCLAIVTLLLKNFVEWKTRDH